MAAPAIVKAFELFTSYPNRPLFGPYTDPRLTLQAPPKPPPHHHRKEVDNRDTYSMYTRWRDSRQSGYSDPNPPPPPKPPSDPGWDGRWDKGLPYWPTYSSFARGHRLYWRRGSRRRRARRSRSPWLTSYYPRATLKYR